MNEELIVSELLNKERVVDQIERRLKKSRQYRPVITISREPGSGGKPVAKLLAKKMGFRFYDKSLIEKVGTRIKLPTTLLSRVDEKGRSGVVDLVHNIFDPDYISDEVYFRNLCQVILQISQKGSAVIVGRGANFIIPQMYALRVHIVAPYRVRVARAVQFEHIERTRAREIIREASADRANYVKQYFGKNIAFPKYYDLEINTTFLSIEQTAELLMRAYKMKFPKINF